MGNRSAKVALFDEFARAAKALAGGRRLELLDVLANGERTVDALAGEVALSVARRLEDGEPVVILDVRSAGEHAAGRVPGAVSVPVEELHRRMAEPPRDREIVTYCRGPYCAFAHEAVELLRNEGFAARRLEDGLPEWQATGRVLARS